jgi:3-hydroxyacyl-CoA dehydrogenase
MSPNEITIRYEKGEMIIRLENFFNPPSIMRTRKLLEVIQSSHTPEAANQIFFYITDVLQNKRIEQMRLTEKQTKNRIDTFKKIGKEVLNVILDK